MHNKHALDSAEEGVSTIHRPPTPTTNGRVENRTPVHFDIEDDERKRQLAAIIKARNQQHEREARRQRIASQQMASLPRPILRTFPHVPAQPPSTQLRSIAKSAEQKEASSKSPPQIRFADKDAAQKIIESLQGLKAN
eukprot:c12158_g1_i2.p1 GENE.c12158_g1_i2~~c12158_g1_i2.p1  ORF type:complete len:138 (+),score=22.84 c12158_g1_i2:196-609(+)